MNYKIRMMPFLFREIRDLVYKRHGFGKILMLKFTTDLLSLLHLPFRNIFHIKIHRTFYQIKGAEDGGSFSFFLLLFIIKNFEIIIKIKIINLKFASELQRS